MRPISGSLLWLVALLGVLLPRGPLHADVSHVIHDTQDDRGGAVHVVPLTNDRVRMVAERVVLVPYYDARAYAPRLLVHVWYDLRNEGPAARLQVGFPELKALFRQQVTRNMGPAAHLDKVSQKWTLPTILAFRARRGATELAAHRYPGVGPYRRWFTFGLDLRAGETVRLHTTYLATLGSTAFSMDRDEDDLKPVRSYFLHYVLHTGARWRGPIGRGEILLYWNGRLRRLRSWKDLEPTRKDDVSLGLDLLVDLPRTEPMDDLGPGEKGYRLPAGNRVVRHRLTLASSSLDPQRVDAHVGLVVDGDPETRWVSGKRALGAYVQLPSDPKHDLTGLRIWSGTPAAGQVRPARVEVECLARWRWATAAKAELPDNAGPHAVALSRARRCKAVRVRIRAVHGDRNAPVTLAEVEPQLAGGAVPGTDTTGTTSGHTWTDPLATPRNGPGSKAWPLPAAANPRAFERAEIDRVSWSADGTLVHYRLHLEDVRQRPRGVRLGVFADVATGRVIRAYRLDRHGTLPEPYARWWREAMTYEAGVALLDKHGFQKALASRRPPRRSPVKGSLVLTGTVEGEPKALAVAAARTGYRWRYSPRRYQGQGVAKAAFALGLRAKREAPRVLHTHGVALDRGFAGRHARLWLDRRKLFEAAARDYIASHGRMGLETEAKEEDAKRWHGGTYPQWQAYAGEAQVFWHPKGEALLVVWSDHQDYSMAVPDPKPEQLVPECAELEWKVCPWDRKDDVRRNLAVTVHSLVPRQPTTLLAAYRPPATPPKPVAAARGMAPKPRSGGRAMAVAPGKKAPPKKKGGCGCGAGGPPLAPLLPLPVLLLLWLARISRATRPSCSPGDRSCRPGPPCS